MNLRHLNTMLKNVVRALSRQSGISIAVIGISLFVASFAVMARFRALSFPHEVIFDEVYFPVFANNLLHGALTFDVHPPFGKFLLAVGIWLFGNAQFGWRIVPAIAGIGLVAVSGLWWYRWQKDWFGAVIIATFLIIEPVLIAYARTGLLDGILLLLIIITFCLATRAQTRKTIFVMATFLGLAVATKWLAIGVVVPVGYVLWRKGMVKQYVISLVWSGIVYFLIVFAGELVGHVPQPFSAVWEWHKQTWHYQTTLPDTHPWSSKWYTWPLETRPVLLYYKESGDIVRLMTTLGNPLLWWASTLAVLGSIGYLAWQRFEKQVKIIDHPLIPLLLGYGAFWLPWVGVHRIVFLYHYLPAYWFALCIVVYWLSRIWKHYPYIAAAIYVIFLVSGLYFLPWAIGSELSRAWLAHHVWINSWLY